LAKQGTIVILAVAVVAVLIVASLGVAYKASGGDLPGLDDLPGLGDSDTVGASVVNFRVYLSDGSHRDFNGTLEKSLFGGYSIKPHSMSISLPGTTTTIQKVRSTIIGKIDGVDVQAWVSTSTQRIEFYKEGVSQPLASSTGDYPGGGSAWAKGTEQTLAYLDLAGSDINSVVRQYSNQQGHYSLQYVAFVSLTANVNGQNQFLESHVVGNLNFDYKPDGSGATLTFSARIAPQAIT
jgi:hypothetical protein